MREWSECRKFWINLLCRRQKIQQQSEENLMIADEQRILQLLEPLIKIIKDRQFLYFGALGFANKNIQSSSFDSDQIAIFNKFLSTSDEVEDEIVSRETLLFNKVTANEDPPTEVYKAAHNSKQMRRISARVLQMLQTSIQKSRNTLFYQNGKLGVDFSRFKRSLHELAKQQLIDLTDFISSVIHFIRNKYRRQMNKIRNYLSRLQEGENISLRDIFAKEDSEADVSTHQKNNKLGRTIRPNKKLSKDSSPQTESPTSKRSLIKKSTTNYKIKRTLNIKQTKKNQTQLQIESSQKLIKTATAATIFKSYAMLDLSKKQFLEDYIYEKKDEQKQKKRIMTQLIQKNAKNAQQIRQFKSKCLAYQEIDHNCSADEHSSSVRKTNSPANITTHVSMKTSFTILKRKGSFIMESGSQKSDVQQHSIRVNMSLSRTSKNFSPSYKNSKKLKQPNGDSKKMLVAKSPMVFNDEVMIPKVQFSNITYIKPSFTHRDKARKNQHIRLKKKNNPMPLDQKYLPDSFHVTRPPIIDHFQFI